MAITRIYNGLGLPLWRLRCDRCGAEARSILPMGSQKRAKKRAREHKGWFWVCGQDLCPACFITCLGEKVLAGLERMTQASRMACVSIKRFAERAADKEV